MLVLIAIIVDDEAFQHTDFTLRVPGRKLSCSDLGADDGWS